jgi:hypothetical protein
MESQRRISAIRVVALTAVDLMCDDAVVAVRATGAGPMTAALHTRLLAIPISVTSTIGGRFVFGLVFFFVRSDRGEQTWTGI